MRIKITALRLVSLGVILLTAREIIRLPTYDPWAVLQGRPRYESMAYGLGNGFTGRSIAWDYVASDLWPPILLIALIYLGWLIGRHYATFFRREWRKCYATAYLLLALYFLIDVPYAYTESYRIFGRFHTYTEYAFIWNVRVPTVLYGRIMLTQLALLVSFAAVLLLLKFIPTKPQS